MTSAVIEAGKPFYLKHKYEQCHITGWNEYCNLAHEETLEAYPFGMKTVGSDKFFIWQYEKEHGVI